MKRARAKLEQLNSTMRHYCRTRSREWDIPSLPTRGDAKTVLVDARYPDVAADGFGRRDFEVGFSLPSQVAGCLATRQRGWVC